MRIGIFGGSFDPVHTGHIRCASDVYDEFSLDKIVFVPVKTPVHKAATAASPADRLAMLDIALNGYDNFTYSDMEIVREEQSYSLYTIRDTATQFPGCELYFILGTDSFNTLLTWYKPEEIVKMCRFIVMRRSEYPIDEKLVSWAGNVLEAANAFVDISSTEIRNAVKKSRRPELVDAPVWTYIIERGLYR